VPYHDVAGVPDGLDPNKPIAAICASGQRSAVAASLLLRAGAGDVLHVAGGGVGAWPDALETTPAPEHVPGPA
jgi:rhodanese-related sulfurtransferase